jgi:prepilin signal peptidase PulO-like enzyme (type II secretory pathway)
MIELFIFIFGLCIGSFLNVVILRIKDGKSLRGRSQCPACGQQLRWYHNIPIFSFLFLHGRCAFCKAKISWQYPLVELVSGFLWLIGYWHVIANPDFYQGEAISKMATGIASLALAMTLVPWLQVLTFGVFASFLLVLFVFDLRWYILPDEITLPAIAVALALNLILGKNWQALLLATALGAVWFGAQYLISRGKWVGDGDIRLGALIGVMMASWQGLLVVFFIAYILGSLVGVGLILARRRNMSSQLPFGTFLAVAAIIGLLWGQNLWDWYWGILW